MKGDSLQGSIKRQEPLIPAAKLGTMRGCIRTLLYFRYEGLFLSKAIVHVGIFCTPYGYMGIVGTTSSLRESRYRFIYVDFSSCIGHRDIDIIDMECTYIFTVLYYA